MNVASTLIVYCAGAMKAAVADLAGKFERDTGHTLTFTYGPVGGLRTKAVAENPDVLILSAPALDEMGSEGHVIRETIVRLGTVGVGIAVRNGAPVPDVSTPERLRSALLAAKSLTYGDPAKGDSSGVHFAKVLERLGIVEELRGADPPRARRAGGCRVGRAR